MGSEPDVRSLTLVAITLYILFISSCSSAPSPYGKLRSPREKGCYYLLKHYQNGEQIETNEPCLNCSCVNSMLMCYLRVCPYVRPIGDKCIIEKVPGDCCPRITCPDVPPDPEPEPTTPQPEEEGAGCYVEGKHFREGTQMPPDAGKPCEICYCIRNTSACVSQECSLGVPGCQPTYSPNSCCPTRYNCSAEAATTVPPELRHPSVPELGCRANGRTYVDGEAVPSKDPCEHCYCMKHEVVCAVQECKAPCEGCTPIPSENDHCCPERYECPAPKRPVPHRDIYSNETHVTTTITTTIAVNRIESETESSSAPPESASSPPPTPTTTGTQEPEQSSSTVESTSQLPISTTQVADALSTNEPSVTPNIPESGSTPEARSESEIREGDHSQTVSATPPAEQATASVTVSTEPTSTGREESEKSTTSAEAIHIGMKIGPQDTETGSTGSPKIGSEIPGDGEKVDSEVTAATPGFENDGTEVATESPVVNVPVENMLMPASQPRRDEAGDRISTRRPGTQRKTFPSVGVIPGEGICRYGGKVYQNGDEVVSHNPCVEFCMCINSVVYCDETVCQDIRPIEGQNCSQIKRKTECCPRYECQPFVTSTTTLTTTEATSSTPEAYSSTQQSEATEFAVSVSTEFTATSTTQSSPITTEAPPSSTTTTTAALETESDQASSSIPTTSSGSPIITTKESVTTSTEASTSTVETGSKSEQAVSSTLTSAAVTDTTTTTEQSETTSTPSPTPTSSHSSTEPSEEPEPTLENEIHTDSPIKTTLADEEGDTKADTSPAPDDEMLTTLSSDIRSTASSASTTESIGSSTTTEPDIISEIPVTENPTTGPPQEMKLDGSSAAVSTSTTPPVAATSAVTIDEEVEKETTTETSRATPVEHEKEAATKQPQSTTVTSESDEVETQTSTLQPEVTATSTTTATVVASSSSLPTSLEESTTTPAAPSDIISIEDTKTKLDSESGVVVTILPIDEVSESTTTESVLIPAPIHGVPHVVYENETLADETVTSTESSVSEESHSSTQQPEETTSVSDDVTDVPLVSTSHGSTTEGQDTSGSEVTTAYIDIESKGKQSSTTSTPAAHTEQTEISTNKMDATTGEIHSSTQQSLEPQSIDLETDSPPEFTTPKVLEKSDTLEVIHVTEPSEMRASVTTMKPDVQESGSTPSALTTMVPDTISELSTESESLPDDENQTAAPPQDIRREEESTSITSTTSTSTTASPITVVNLDEILTPAPPPRVQVVALKEATFSEQISSTTTTISPSTSTQTQPIVTTDQPVGSEISSVTEEHTELPQTIIFSTTTTTTETSSIPVVETGDVTTFAPAEPFSSTPLTATTTQADVLTSTKQPETTSSSTKTTTTTTAAADTESDQATSSVPTTIPDSPSTTKESVTTSTEASTSTVETESKREQSVSSTLTPEAVVPETTSTREQPDTKYSSTTESISSSTMTDADMISEAAITEGPTIGPPEEMKLGGSVYPVSSSTTPPVTSTTTVTVDETQTTTVTGSPDRTQKPDVSTENIITITFSPNATTFTLSTMEPTFTSSVGEDLSSTAATISTDSSSVEAVTPGTITTPPSRQNETSNLPAREEEEEQDDTTCIYEGKAYRSAEQVPRSHPCDFCFCFRGDIICLQQTCPPPIPGCNETPIRGFCCPRYQCPVSSSSSNSTTPRSVAERRGCNVNGQFYEIGDKIKRASSPCLECVCDHSGMVRCNPQDCSPEAPLIMRMSREFMMASRKKR